MRTRGVWHAGSIAFTPGATLTPKCYGAGAHRWSVFQDVVARAAVGDMALFVMLPYMDSQHDYRHAFGVTCSVVSFSGDMDSIQLLAQVRCSRCCTDSTAGQRQLSPGGCVT